MVSKGQRNRGIIGRDVETLNWRNDGGDGRVVEERRGSVRLAWLLTPDRASVGLRGREGGDPKLFFGGARSGEIKLMLVIRQSDAIRQES